MDVDERKARLLRAKQYSTLVRYVKSRLCPAPGCWSLHVNNNLAPSPTREMFKPVAPHDDSGGSGRVHVCRYLFPLSLSLPA